MSKTDAAYMRAYRARRKERTISLETVDQINVKLAERENRIAELESEVRRLEAQLARRVSDALDRPAIRRGFGQSQPAPKPGKGN